MLFPFSASLFLLGIINDPPQMLFSSREINGINASCLVDELDGDLVYEWPLVHASSFSKYHPQSSRMWWYFQREVCALLNAIPIEVKMLTLLVAVHVLSTRGKHSFDVRGEHSSDVRGELSSDARGEKHFFDNIIRSKEEYISKSNNHSLRMLTSSCEGVGLVKGIETISSKTFS